jgi:hypothetical protein
MGDAWDKLIGTGVVGAVLAILLVGIIWTAIWLRKHVVEPVIAAHLGLIKSLQEQVPKQTERMDRISDVAKQALETANKAVDAQIEQSGVTRAGNIKHSEQLRDIKKVLLEQTGELHSGNEKIVGAIERSHLDTDKLVADARDMTLANNKLLRGLSRKPNETPHEPPSDS